LVRPAGHAPKGGRDPKHRLLVALVDLGANLLLQADHVDDDRHARERVRGGAEAEPVKLVESVGQLVRQLIVTGIYCRLDVDVELFRLGLSLDVRVRDDSACDNSDRPEHRPRDREVGGHAHASLGRQSYQVGTGSSSAARSSTGLVTVSPKTRPIWVVSVIIISCVAIPASVVGSVSRMPFWISIQGVRLCEPGSTPLPT